jgi:ADP-ribose pyrophosphatase YjhB (NUDIX family)
MTTPQWKEPAVPRHVIQMLVGDGTKYLIMHRSNNVRSARNVWSIPSGEHEIGETIQACAYRELEEEYGLVALDHVLLDQYENIAGDESPPHYHWVISLYGIKVEDVTKAINREPDKHDQMIFPTHQELNKEFFESHQFHPSLHETLNSNIQGYTGIMELML